MLCIVRLRFSLLNSGCAVCCLRTTQTLQHQLGSAPVQPGHASHQAAALCATFLWVSLLLGVLSQAAVACVFSSSIFQCPPRRGSSSTFSVFPQVDSHIHHLLVMSSSSSVSSLHHPPCLPLESGSFIALYFLIARLG